jgi:hypothetical protein
MAANGAAVTNTSNGISIQNPSSGVSTQNHTNGTSTQNPADDAISSFLASHRWNLPPRTPHPHQISPYRELQRMAELSRRLEVVRRQQQERRQIYGDECEEWRIGHTPVEKVQGLGEEGRARRRRLLDMEPRPW